jgi:hypothetical protein
MQKENREIIYKLCNHKCKKIYDCDIFLYNNKKSHYYNVCRKKLDECIIYCKNIEMYKLSKLRPV